MGLFRRQLFRHWCELHNIATATGFRNDSSTDPLGNGQIRRPKSIVDGLRGRTRPPVYPTGRSDLLLYKGGVLHSI